MSLQERAGDLWGDIQNGPYKKGTREHKEWVIERFRIAFGELEQETRMVCAYNVRALCDAQIKFLGNRYRDDIVERARISDYRVASEHAHDACLLTEDEVKKLADDAKKHGVL